MADRSKLEQLYFELGNELPKINKDLQFENHCYWRIALDTVAGAKWNHSIASPAYKNLTKEQLEQVIQQLKTYKTNRNQLLSDNTKSLSYRKK